MSSGASVALSCALRSGQPLPDSLIISYLEELQEEPQQPSNAGAAEHLQVAGGQCGDVSAAMMLARREQTIRATGDRLAPSAFVLNPGGKVVLAVAQGPSQAFYISKDAEDRFVTPTIRQGTTYEWTPAEPGRYVVQSEVYPHLRSTIQVLQETQQEEATSVPAPGELATARRRRTSSMLGSSGHGSSLADELSSSRGASAVDESISFPALVAARPAGWSGNNNSSSSSSGGRLNQCTQTQPGGSSGTVSRHTSTSTGAPGMVLGRFAQAAEEEDDDEFDLEAAEGPGSLLDAPAGSGLRRRPLRSGGAPLPGAPPGAGVPSATAQQQQQAGVLPPLKPAQPAGVAGRESFSVLSSGSGSSPRSGSERSSSSAPPLVVQRRIPGGMLQTTHAYPSAAGRSGYSDSLSGGSDEKQPLLFNVSGSRSGQAPLHSPSFGSSTGRFRAYPAAVPPHMHPRPQEDRVPTPHKCPRCRKEYLSTINQRRCISSHLGSGRAARGAGAGGSMPDSAQLAAFWDELDEGEKRAVMDLRGELNGEMLMRQLEIQKLHRQRSGAMDQLTQEQKRLHTSGLLLHSACEGGRGSAGVAAAIQRLTGANLMRVLSEVSEGTFLADRNPISQEEFVTGDNLEAGLGALVSKRLVDAHLAAKQRQADRMQRELEDQEAEQQAQKAGKKKLKAKGKGKAVVATALPAGKPASKATPAAAAAAAAPALTNASAVASDDESMPAAARASQQQQQQPAAAELADQQPPAAEQANGTTAGEAKAAGAAPPAAEVLSPPRPGGGERYGSSPAKPSKGTSASFTNFLFAEEGEAEPQPVAVARAGAETAANGWRMAGSGRASRAPIHPVGAPKAGRSSSSSRAPPAAAAAAAAAAPKGTARGPVRSSSSGVQPERPSSRTAAERAAPAAASAAVGAATAPKKATAPSNGKLATAATSSRHQTNGAAAAPVASSKAQQQQAAPPNKESFPALPASANGKPAAPAGSGSAPGASFSYAAAASKSRKEGGKGPAGPKPEPAAAAAQQQQQQQQVAASSLSQQPKSWPVPGAGSAAASPAPQQPADSSTMAAAGTVAPAANSAEPTAAASAHAAGQEEVRAAAPQPEVPAAFTAAAAPAAPCFHAAALAQVPAAAWEGAAGEQERAAAEDAQRCASVTPPISDAGSPPPAVLMPPPGAYPMPPGWPVGMDGAPLPPPPLGFYWMVAPPLPPPGMQFGSVEPGEMMGPGPGPYMGAPYPFYPHAPYPVLPPGHPGAGGMGMPLPHMLPYDGQLAPFPPGMPVPMPHDTSATEEMVGQQGNWEAAGPEPAGAESAAEEERALPDAELAQQIGTTPADQHSAAGQEEEQQIEEKQQQAEEEQEWEALHASGASAASSDAPAGRTKSSSFLEMMQAACGVPAGPAQLPPAAPAPGGGRRRGAPRTPPAFDAAAAAAELDRRWKAAAPRSIHASSLSSQCSIDAAGAAAAAVGPPVQRPDRRSSSGGTVSSKAVGAPARGSTAGQVSSKPIAKVSGSGSGRNSPAAGAKPVVVAVRAWSSSEESAHADSHGPKWRIQAAAAAAAAAAAKQQSQMQQQAAQDRQSLRP